MGFQLKSIFLVVSLISGVNLSHSLSLHVEESSRLLPVPMIYSTAVYDGQDSIYILGGQDRNTGRPAGVFKYSIATDRVEKIGDIGNIYCGSGVWTGPNEIHFFGTDVLTLETTGVWRIDPTDLDSRIRVHNLTSQIFFNSAVWDGKEFIYSFDGYYTQNSTYKYSKKTTTLTEFNNLPPERYFTSAVWDDVQNKAYIFGGSSSSFGDLDEIVEFDPVTNTATKLNTSLVSKVSNSCAAWTGTLAYIIGGWRVSSSSRFTPSTETVQSIVLDINYALYDHSCVWISKLNRIYVFGGQMPHSDRISYIDLPQEETPTTTRTTTTTTTRPSTTLTPSTTTPTAATTETPTTTRTATTTRPLTTLTPSTTTPTAATTETPTTTRTTTTTRPSTTLTPSTTTPTAATTETPTTTRPSTTLTPSTTTPTAATTETPTTTRPSTTLTPSTTTPTATASTTPGSGASLLIDQLSDMKEGWESNCPGYHELQNFTCSNPSFLIPEIYRNDHVGYWTQCRKDQVVFFCRVNFRPTADLWKQLTILAYINGTLPIEVMIEDSTGYYTKFFGGEGWTTSVLDLSQHVGIKLIQITPEYIPSNYAVIDQIELTA